MAADHRRRIRADHRRAIVGATGAPVPLMERTMEAVVVLGALATWLVGLLAMVWGVPALLVVLIAQADDQGGRSADPRSKAG